MRAMDYFLAELIAKMGESLLAMQAHCGDQTRAMLCSSGAKGNWECQVTPTAMLC